MPDERSQHPNDPDPPPPDRDADPTIDERSWASRNQAETLASRSAEWVGRTINKYRITGLLGVGGMGYVFRAHDATLERDVAIKILPDEFASRSDSRERFLAEAKAAAKLSHPHVVAIYEVGQEGATCFIVMELLTGGNAAERLEAQGAFPPAEATRMMIDACRGVAAAHTVGLIHRDIKPGNLLRAQHEATKIADFGLVKGAARSAQHVTQDGVIVGTPSYMSPEQCESKPVDRRSDIYALGATYYALLTGAAPYADAGSTVQMMYAQCHADIPDPRKTNPDLPEACTAIIARAMAKRPEDRYQSADEMRLDLEAIAPGMATVSSGAPSPTSLPSGVTLAPPPRPRSRRRTWAAVLALILVGVAAGAVYVASRNSGDADRSPDGRSAAAAVAVPGVTDDTVTFGTTAAFSGPNRDLGREMVEGIRASFDAVNQTGGVHGRKLELVVLDDGYEPQRADANMRELFEKRDVFAVIGNVGTPTAAVTVPYALEHRRLFFAPLTGAALLRRDPPDRYVFNYRASYADETAALVNYFIDIKECPPNQIAVFAQNDAFGDDGFEGVVHALHHYGIDPEDILRVNYDRNTARVNAAVDELVAHQDQVKAVILIATYAPAARLIRMARDRGLKADFGAVSFIDSDMLAEQFQEIGPEYGEGVVVTQVVPHYLSNSTGVIRYRDALDEFAPEAHPGFVSLEGFIAAECLIEGLRIAGRNLTTERLVDALESIHDYDLGIGPIIRFGPSRRQASDKVWGTVLDASGNYQVLDLENP